nr:hypothetical protein [Tanacetum cinerariifolium]
MSLFGQDDDTFRSMMLLNADQLQKQLDKDEFQEDGSMAAFWVVNNQFQKDTRLQHMGNVKKSVGERTRHQKQYDRGGTESEVQDDSNRSGNDTDADDADIRLVYDEEPMDEVQLTVEGNILAIGQHHTKQPEIINEGRVNNYPEQCQVKSPMLDSSPDNQTTDYSKQSLEQPNAFKSKRPQMSKPRFASQVDVNKNLSKPVTQHYFPKKRKSGFAKPNHMIASSESRNSSKNMPRFSSNDMVHNHYLDEARKKTHERDWNSKTSVMPYARFQSAADGNKPKPRSTNHSTRSLPAYKNSYVTITVVPKPDHSRSSSSFSYYKYFVCSTCHKCVFNANHDACITKLLKWIPTGKLFDSCTSKDDSEPTHGSNVDIPNIHESKQTLDLSACTSINVQKEQGFDLSAEVPSTDTIVMTSMRELESLFGPFFDEYFNGENQDVSKSFTVTIADAFDKRQQQPDSTSSTSALATTVTADENFDL